MKLVYHCFGGAHTSITCASIHLNYLPKDKIPTERDFRSIPFYDEMESHRVGTALFMGKDELGFDVYVWGMKGGKSLVIPSIRSYINQSNPKRNEILFVNALANLHPLTSIGGITSRRLGLVSIGRAMTIRGIIITYPAFVDLVARVKENLRKRSIFLDL